MKIPENHKLVKFGKNNFLFVDMGEYTIQVKNPFDYIPNSVEIVQSGYNYYVKNFEPKLEEKYNKEIVEEAELIDSEDDFIEDKREKKNYKKSIDK